MGLEKQLSLKMILGMESIDKGTFEVGQTVRIGYADQTHKDIDPKKTVLSGDLRRSGIDTGRRKRD